MGGSMPYLFWGIILLMTFGVILFLRSYLKWTLMLLIPVLTLSLYGLIGHPKALMQYWEHQRELKRARQELLHLKSPALLIQRLKAYLSVHPNDARAWYLLGKLYYGQQDFSNAVDATHEAYRRQPGHSAYAVAYSEADYFYHSRRLSPQVKKILKNVIVNDKSNVSALNLLAVDAYQRKAYRKAADYWQRLLPQFSVESKGEQYLLSMIAKAQKKEK